MSTQTGNNADIVCAPLGECTTNNVALCHYTTSAKVNSEAKYENARISLDCSSIGDMNYMPHNASIVSGKAKKRPLNNIKSKNGSSPIGPVGLTNGSTVMVGPSFGGMSDINKLASTNNGPSEPTDTTTAEMTSFPVEAFAKITKRKDRKKPVPDAGSPLLVAKAPLRQKSKSHKPVKKVVRDSKHGNPMLRIKARADQLKAHQKTIVNLDDVSSDHTSKDASDATISKDPSLYNGEQRMVSYAVQEKSEAESDDGVDIGVQVDLSSISMQNMELHSVPKDHSSQLKSDEDAETIILDSESCRSIKESEGTALCDTIVPEMIDESGIFEEEGGPFNKPSTSWICARQEAFGAAMIEYASSITVSEQEIIDTPTTPLGLLAIPNSSEYPDQLSREIQEQLVSTYVHPFLAGAPITPAGLLTFTNGEQYPSTIYREMQQTLVAMHVTAVPVVCIQPDTFSLCTMPKDAPTVIEDEDTTVTDVGNSQNAGSSSFSESSTTKALEQIPSFLLRSKADDTQLSQKLDSHPHSMNASESQFRPAVNSLQVYKLRNTYLGIISLEDFIQQLDFSKNNMISKRDICVAFATLSAKEARVFGFDGIHWAMDDIFEEYRSPVIQHQIKLGGTTLHAFLVSIHFQLDWTVSIEEVAAAFRRLSEQDSVGPSPKAAAFLRLEASA